MIAPQAGTKIMRALDLFCGAGGVTKGLQRAGFHVTGVDINPQPRYCGDRFVQADFRRCGLRFKDFDFVWASPPCQRYSDLAKRNGNANAKPDFVPTVRHLLQGEHPCWVIENVEGAPLQNPVMLCGTMFPGLRVLRHRLFEANFMLTAPAHHKHPICHTHDRRKKQFGKTNEWTDFVQVTGGGNSTVAAAKDAMGIDWPMTKAEINESIPPAYAEYIGRAAIAHITSQRMAAE